MGALGLGDINSVKALRLADGFRGGDEVDAASSDSDSGESAAGGESSGRASFPEPCAGSAMLRNLFQSASQTMHEVHKSKG